MSVYHRYKRDPDGLRHLVELLETTPLSRRKKMIEVGMSEDPQFTELAISFMFTFEDLLRLPDLELAELIATAPPRVTALAISKLDSQVQNRIFKNAISTVLAELRDSINPQAELREVGGAQMKWIEIARGLEKKGLIKTKQIPGGPGH